MGLKRTSFNRLSLAKFSSVVTGTGAGTGTGTGPTSSVTISSIQIANSSFVAKDDLAIDTAGGYMIVNGTGFQSGAVVYIQGTAATSTAFVSASQLNVTVQSLSSGLLDVYVVNPDNSGAINIRSLSANGVPSWTTTSPLSSKEADTAFSINLVATGAAGDGTITYAVSSGSSLPSGTTLASNGYFSGTVTNLSQETTFSFNVDAIDAQLQETVRTFSITFTVGDTNFKDTVLLLNGETSNNTWITDTSTNNFALTVNGDTRPTAFSPYETVWSNYFDGTGDYLTVPSNAAFQFGTGDFTVEFWLNTTDTAFNIVGLNTAGAGNWMAVILSSTFYWQNAYATTNLFSTSATGILDGAWHHVAVTRLSGTTRVYFDGVSQTSASDSANYNGGGAVQIGSGANGDLLGYISNLRLLKGTALYTTNFTPSTSALTAIANTSLLTCQSNRLIDNSTNNFTITKNGDVTVSNFGPFTETDLVTGSGYFDGTGDYLTVGTSTNLALGAGDFTVETWLYPTAYNASTSTIFDYRTAGSTPTNIPVFLLSASGVPTFYQSVSLGATLTASSAVPLNAWSHLALVRNGSSITIYLNGTSIGSATGTNPLGIETLRINDPQGSYGQAGYFSNFRIVKGTAVYTSSFTPPTAPLTAIANTSLLTLQSRIGENNNRFVDSSSLNNFITRNGNVTQGTFSPFQRGGWSNYFDGTGDYFSLTGTTALNFGTGDFTVEFWVYFNSIAADRGFLGSTSNGGYDFVWRTSTGLNIGRINTAFDNTFAWSPSANVWYHVAYSRSGSSLRVFVNGTQVGSTATNSISYDGGSTVIIGGSTNVDRLMNGYISNLRVIKGTALYTSAFTAPALPLTAIANTSLLTCADSGFVDRSPNNFTLTRNGDISVQPFSPFKAHTITANTHSVYFDGTGDYLTVADDTSLDAFSDFTIECWAYWSSTAGTFQVILDKGWNNGSYGAYLLTLVSGDLKFYAGSTGSSWDVASPVSLITPTANQWYHIAITRSGSSGRCFINGTQVTTFTSSATLLNSSVGLGIGAAFGGAYPINGYISNLRILKGTALYTSAFTPPTSPLTAISNTSLLTCSSNTIVDLSTANTGNTAFAITVNGNSKATTVNPLGFTVTDSSPAEYSITNEGGSMYFDGTGDYLTIPDSEVFEMSGNFTVEAFFYIQSLPGAGQFADIVTKGAAGVFQPYYFFINSSGSLLFYSSSSGTSWDVASAVSLGTIITNSWYHLAVSRSGSNLRVFLNGNLITTISNSSALTNNTRAVTIGARSDGTEDKFVGYITDVRINKGTGVYTTSFVPPTSPLTPIAGTTLLVNGTNGSIIDYTRKNNLETVGDVKIRNNITKYGNTSMYFDGTGDYLYVPSASINDLVGNFTVEAWIYRAATGAAHSIVNIGDYIGASGILFYVTAGNALAIYTNNALAMSGGTVSATTWTHVALVRSGTGSGNLKLYLNGTNVGTPVTNNSTFSGKLYVGIDFYNGATATNFMNGYIDDLRITKGVARYTSNFTVPSAPFPLK